MNVKLTALGDLQQIPISASSSSWRLRAGAASSSFLGRISQPRNFMRKRNRIAEISRKWAMSPSSRPMWTVLPRTVSCQCVLRPLAPGTCRWRSGA